MTLLECYAQVLIDLWLADGDLEVDGATYKQHVAAVIKEAKEEAILEIEKRLGCDIQTAVDRLEYWEEDFENEIDWSAQDAMQAEEEPAYSKLEAIWKEREDNTDPQVIMGWNGQTIKIARQP